MSKHNTIERRVLLELARQIDPLYSAYVKKGSAEAENKDETHLDYVTWLDQAVNDVWVNGWQKNFPKDSILAEECKPQFIDMGSNRMLVVDGIDGTQNAVRGYPYFATSVAFVVDSEPVIGLIYDPMEKELVVAEKDHGCAIYKDPFHGKPVAGRKLHTSKKSDLKKAMMHLDFGKDGRDEMMTKYFPKVLPEIRYPLVMGGAAKTYVDIAKGVSDGYFHNDLKPWDWAAGVLIVQEAGGKSTYVDGSVLQVDPLKLKDNSIVTTNGILHESFRKLIADC